MTGIAQRGWEAGGWQWRGRNSVGREGEFQLGWEGNRRGAVVGFLVGRRAKFGGTPG